MEDSKLEWLYQKYVHETMKQVKTHKGVGQKPPFRTHMWCEFCGEKKPVWKIVMVENNEAALPFAKLSEIKEKMACPDCIANKALVETHNQTAIDFKARNLAIRDAALRLGLISETE